MNEEKECKINEYPTSDEKQFGYSVAAATIGSIPALGPALQELMQQTIISPLQKRQNEWFADLVKLINKVIDHVEKLNPEQLSLNEEFISTVHHATEVAMRTSSAEKRKLLRNSIVNSLYKPSFDDISRGRFLAIIEIFTPTHIQVLRFLENPETNTAVLEKFNEGEFFLTNSEGRDYLKDDMLRSLICTAFPQLSQNKRNLEIIREDLLRESLIKGAINVSELEQAISKKTTETGDDFLEFIQEPIIKV